MANRTLAHIKKFFSWCVERDYIQISPAERISKPKQVVSRDRVLSIEEIKDIWQACEQIGYPYGALVQFALVTAQRRNEVVTLKWQDIDFKNRIWTLPRENTKTDRTHDVYLSDLAFSILNKAPKQKSDLVFTTTGKTPYSGFSQGKNSLDKKVQKIREKRKEEAKAKAKTKRNDLAPIPDWRIHDLRRTAASHMARLGIAPHVVEKILNHSDGVIRGVAAVYNRHEYTKERKDALINWAEYLGQLVIN